MPADVVHEKSKPENLMRLKPLAPQTTIEPGQTVEGTIVSAFRMTKQEWDARKGLDFSFAIQYQPDLKLAPHAAVIDR